MSLSCFGEPTVEDMMGPDKDGNGVRDDIDEYINDVTKDADERNAFRQYAKYLRLGFKNYQDKEKSINNTHTKLKALDCVSNVWEPYHPGWEESFRYSKITDVISEMTYKSDKSLRIKSRISRDFSGQMSGAYEVNEACEFKLNKEY